MSNEETADESMGRFYRKLVNYVSAAVVGTTLLCTALGSIHKTGTTEVGVRTIKWSPCAKSGVEERIYQPGSTYFFLPVINDWTTYDTKLVNVEMTAEQIKGKKQADDLAFKTKDGNDINLDLIVSYRMDPTKATHLRKYVASSDDELQDKIFRVVARSRPRDAFGELSSEEFYQAEKRNEAALKAKRELEDILNDYGIIIEKVAPKDYRFPPQYANAIKEKKLAEARELEFKSKTNAQREENVRMLKEAEGTYNEEVAKIDGKYKQAVIQADAYYDRQAKIAEAIVAEGKAEAAGIKASREAMMSAGGPTFVKMQIADSLKGKNIIMVPSGSNAGNINLQTLDINKFLGVYGINSLAKDINADSSETKAQDSEK